MILIDADILVDAFRGHVPAVEWFDSLEAGRALVVGFAALKLIQGCRDAKELQRVRKYLTRVEVIWPSAEDLNRALRRYGELRLQHGLGILDALIAETAIGAGAGLFTFNKKHYAAF